MLELEGILLKKVDKQTNKMSVNKKFIKYFLQNQICLETSLIQKSYVCIQKD